MARKPHAAEAKLIASVHRFRDKIAVFVGNGETTYLTVAQARKLADAIGSCARDVEFGPDFPRSTFNPVNIAREG